MGMIERKKRLLLMQENGFNYLNHRTWWIATTATDRYKSYASYGEITKEGKNVVLTRTNTWAGLVFLLGDLIAGQQYTISGAYTGTDGKAYIGMVDQSSFNDTYTSTRKFTLIVSNGVVSFVPRQNGKYDLLLWGNSRNPIYAESVILT